MYFVLFAFLFLDFFLWASSCFYFCEFVTLLAFCFCCAFLLIFSLLLLLLLLLCLCYSYNANRFLEISKYGKTKAFAKTKIWVIKHGKLLASFFEAKFET